MTDARQMLLRSLDDAVVYAAQLSSRPRQLIAVLTDVTPSDMRWLMQNLSNEALSQPLALKAALDEVGVHRRTDMALHEIEAVVCRLTHPRGATA